MYRICSTGTRNAQTGVQDTMVRQQACRGVMQSLTANPGFNGHRLHWKMTSFCKGRR
ncbi:hypothetical protein VFPPC_16835 [Pochonia chlamydosporia 170]|uniref:Uncharacterized protein n=1 Tax=Pochonia chlamydosporia 170 TaxID=1380566 RepID=A0A179F265_METCM|nr:hypothetical protein VFPPC_16835 [Pochonia chlamydosporia 170]OAQ59545.1 hypothetical protein VFPPC_16835 [Pochonia chlamydosporia 170]